MAEDRTAMALACRCGAPPPDDGWSAAAAAALVPGAALVLDIAGPASPAGGRRALSREARRAVRFALAAATGCDPHCVVVDASGDAQPRVAGLRCGGPLSDLVREFGISFGYAADRAMVAIGWGLRLGIDIEAQPRPGGRQRRYDAIREAYFADDPTGGEAAGPEDFLGAWTRHEAFLKASGDGITFPADRRDLATEGYAVRSVEAGSSHAAAIAAKAENFEFRVLPAPPPGLA